MQTVLVTGASAGVGEATAELFIEKGCKVILLARSVDTLKNLAGRLGERAVIAPCDAADGDAVAQMAAQIIAEHGVPDVIVNSAGAGAWKSVVETSPQEARAMMDAPYFAAFNVVQAFLGPMLARDSGIIISLNSPACIVPWPGSAGYAAARGALRTFHEALSQDIATSNLHACHVIFGSIDTGYFETNAVDRGQLPTLDKFIPTLTPRQCADAIYGLAQRPKSSLIRPRILSLVAFFARLFPRMGQWFVRL